jgi:hypothetical protein
MRGVSVIGIFDELEDCDPGASDQLIAKKQQ